MEKEGFFYEVILSVQLRVLVCVGFGVFVFFLFFYGCIVVEYSVFCQVLFWIFRDQFQFLLFFLSGRRVGNYYWGREDWLFVQYGFLSFFVLQGRVFVGRVVFWLVFLFSVLVVEFGVNCLFFGCFCEEVFKFCIINICIYILLYVKKNGGKEEKLYIIKIYFFFFKRECSVVQVYFVLVVLGSFFLEKSIWGCG